MEEQDLDMKLYELSFHIDPNLGEEGAEKKFEKILADISKAGGKIERNEKPLLQPLAYPIAKAGRGMKEWCENSYFGSLVFETNISEMQKLETELKNDSDFLRFLIVSLTKVALSEMGKRKIERREERMEERTPPQTSSKVPVVAEALKATSEEELDKKIEEMVA